MQRIFVAEADLLVRKLVVQTLQDLDIQIREVESAQDALAAMAETQCDMLIVGQFFPGDNGATLCETVLADEMMADMAVVVLGDNRADEARLALMEAGAVDFVPLPFSPREFRVRVQGLLRTRLRFQNRLQLLLKHADESRSKVIESFSLGVAHNVNNLLTALMGHASLAKSYAINDNAICHLDAASNCAQRMCELAQQLLAFAGEVKHTQALHSLTAIVRWSVAIFDHVALKHRVILRCRLPEDRLLVHCDEFEMTTVLLQILNNAREAMPDGGMIRVRAYVDEDEAVVEIADNGKGMSPEMVSMAKNPFVTTKMTVGVGLGLSMSQGVVQGFGGKLDIVSSEGEGTTVFIRLPLAAAGSVHSHDAPPASIIPNCTVALVIDSTDSRGLFGALLERIGIGVVCLDDIRGLMQELGNERLHIKAAVIDLSMAIETARVAVAKVRAIYPDFPLICLGVKANDLPEDDVNTRSLIKPFAPDSLIATLASFGESLFG